MTGGKVDLLKFPVLRSHASDGGRYIGTGDVLINQDPESGYINMGTYRMQLHERNLLGLWMSPGQHGQIIGRRYWEKGKSCPIVATFGQDPLTFMASNAKIPWGRSELDFVGGLRGRPLDIVKGPITGLPIPAHAEIAIEGEIPPPSEQCARRGAVLVNGPATTPGNGRHGRASTRHSGQRRLPSQQSHYRRRSAAMAGRSQSGFES